ncbi:MAG: tRNA (N(6)-L-threonylcarbamoyladenosine(37)-C(2))-methylthiotransferase MtaB [Proteobacteria bacterium]|nr:tRNA (N(6)-L-threonylcarbamoyladenosine(37)-C(2))-methylthiotransferase MtaB [Pseudomonadota bacterium]
MTIRATAPGNSGPELITFGCRLNTLESEVIRSQAQSADDTIIVNTCAVTASAVRQARQSIRSARRRRPDAQIVVTGCAAQLDPTAFANMPEVDRVLGNQEKLQPASLDFGVAMSERVQVNDIMSVTETAGHLVDGLDGRTRAFVQVQNGCDHRCTFCIIPFARGNSRSVPMGAVIDQCRRLIDNGYQEIVLTGVDITAYGTDLPGSNSLGTLVQKILMALPDLPRLRLSSIDSVEVDAPLLDAITSETRLMPHLHLSLQAGDDMVLKRMKRRHNREQSVAFCDSIRAARPDVVFGADLIAGFPTETDAMFENTLNAVDEAGLTYLHVFPYSSRPGTPAAKMPMVPGELVRERAARLRAKGQERKAAFFAGQLGASVSMLVEKVEDGVATGHSEHFAPIRLQGATEGIVTAIVTDFSDQGLVATAA